MSTINCDLPDEIVIPVTISTRTAGLEPLLRAWRKDHPGVPWSKLIDPGLKKELAKYAGKRYAHLVQSGFVSTYLLLVIAAICISIGAGLAVRHGHYLIGAAVATGVVVIPLVHWIEYGRKNKAN